MVPSLAIIGRPMERISVFVSLRDAEKNVGASGAVTCTNFQVGVTLADPVM